MAEELKNSTPSEHIKRTGFKGSTVPEGDIYVPSDAKRVSLAALGLAAVVTNPSFDKEDVSVPIGTRRLPLTRLGLVEPSQPIQRGVDEEPLAA